jgi:hypothetical protein
VLRNFSTVSKAFECFSHISKYVENIGGVDLNTTLSASEFICDRKLPYFYICKKLPPYTLAGFEPKTHSSSPLGDYIFH